MSLFDCLVRAVLAWFQSLPQLLYVWVHSQYRALVVTVWRRSLRGTFSVPSMLRTWSSTKRNRLKHPLCPPIRPRKFGKVGAQFRSRRAPDLPVRPVKQINFILTTTFQFASLTHVSLTLRTYFWSVGHLFEIRQFLPQPECESVN